MILIVSSIILMILMMMEFSKESLVWLKKFDKKKNKSLKGVHKAKV